MASARGSQSAVFTAVAMFLVAVLPLNAIAAAPLTNRLPLADITQTEFDSFLRFSEASASFDTKQRPLASLDPYSSEANNRNDITDAICKPVTLLFARGTTEEGNMGSLVGPSLAKALGLAVGEDSLAVQGVDYDASVEGFFAGGDPEGSKTMAGLIAMRKSNCDNTTLVVAGYSQGAQLLHNAAALLANDEKAFVKAAILFGDPNNGQSIGGISNVKTICHERDSICAGGKVVNEAHLTYNVNVGEAVSFALRSTNVRGTGKSKTPKEIFDALGI